MDELKETVRRNWDEPTMELGRLRFFTRPPADWIDPTPRASGHATETGAATSLWPWSGPRYQYPAAMPSGHSWPRISLVTVTFNQGAYLEQTLRSVLLQGYPNLEYIVIDGGSTDDTAAILSRYERELAHCISEPDDGQGDALNKGFRRTTGEILAWLNSDDYYLPDTLVRVALAFDHYPTDMVVGGCQLIQGQNNTPFRTHHCAMPFASPVRMPVGRLLDIYGCWQQGEFFYQPEVFWSRDIWDRAGGRVDETLYYSMDYELWVRMAIRGARLVHVPEPLAVYRVHEGQKTYGIEPPFVGELREVSAKWRQQVALDAAR
jgi:GT2 family glycosyltransferase